MALGFGIVGYGGMGGWHSRYINTVEGAEVAAVYDIDPERNEVARADGFKTYDSLAEFLNDKDIDAVVIATPNDVHSELSLQCSKAGKHVIVEKPVALAMEELETMIEAASKYNRLFTVHQNRRWDKDYIQVRNTLQSGILGTPYIIESRIHGPNGAIHGWRSKKEKGGGMMLDWGVHLVDQLLWMIPTEIKQVNCVMRKLFGYDVDDYLRLQIEFSDGLLAYVEIGVKCLQPLPRWYVGGQNGTLLIDKINGDGSVTILEQAAPAQSGPLKDTGAGPTRTFGKVGGVEVTSYGLPQVEADWLDFYRNFIDTVEGKANLIVECDQIRRVMSVIEAAFESADSGSPVFFI